MILTESPNTLQGEAVMNTNKIKSLKSNLAFNLTAAVVLLLLIFSWIVSAIGYVKFTDSLTAEYNDSAFRTAETAAALINADNIDLYLETGGNSEEYKTCLNRLNLLCNKQNVSLIYAIAVDTSDYEHFTSVFNCVNENSGYTPWEIGYVRETSNDEYKQVYKDIYENGKERETVVRKANLNGVKPHITSLIPLKASDGTVRAVMCVQRPMAELDTGRRSYLRWVAVVVIFLSFLVSLLTTLYINRQFVKPVRKITKEAARFAAENNRSETYSFKNISRINEISTLAEAIEQMEDDTLKNIQQLTQVTAEKERVGAELNIASKIQEGMLPNIFPAFPDRTEFDIYAEMFTAKEVGGDFYDFFLIDDDHLAVVMADVSGKGVPAALFMMASKILINNFSSIEKNNPAKILETVNHNICSSNKAEMFVTAWLGILEISTGTLKAANAGHEYPALQRANGQFELYKDKHGFVLGGMDGITYKNYEIKLNPNDAIFLYTDGVTEATNAENELFGNNRLLMALNKAPDENPQKILENVKTSIDSFVGEAPQFDDITMLSLRYIGGKNE